MVRTKFLIRGLAVGAAFAAVGLTVSAPVSAAPATADRNVIGAPAGKLPAEVLEAMQRDLGLNREQAERQLVVQNAARRLDARLRSQLGGDFAGDWFDQASGKLVVAVTSTKRVAEVRAAGAEPKLVSHSQAKLDAIKGVLDALAATDKAALSGISAWHVDPRSNAVVVTAVKGQPPAKALAGLARHGNAVRIEQSDLAPSLATDYLDGGDPFNGCSVGFNAFSGSTRYFLTAGHCGTVGTPATGAGGVNIGPFVGSSFPGNDYALVRVDNTGYWIQGPWVDAYDGGVYNVHNWYLSAPPAGLFVCKSGRTTRLTCGNVTVTSETVNTDRGTVHQLTRHSACVERGDSGGSNISWEGANVMAEGLTSAAWLLANGRCRSTAGLENWSWFQPIGEAAGAYGVSLYTT